MNQTMEQMTCLPAPTSEPGTYTGPERREQPVTHKDGTVYYPRRWGWRPGDKVEPRTTKAAPASEPRPSALGVETATRHAPLPGTREKISVSLREYHRRRAEVEPEESNQQGAS